MVEIRLEWEVSWKKLKNRRFGWGLAKPSCSGGGGEAKFGPTSIKSNLLC